MKSAVLVAYGRSGIAKAMKGSLRYTGVVDYASQVLAGILASHPELDPAQVDDLICGCALPQAEQGFNIGRTVALSAGLPQSVPGQTVNRFCASGLQSIAAAANAIMVGQAKCLIAGGLENMSKIQMHRVVQIPDSQSYGTDPNIYTTMGITAENVAKTYGISRERQDEFSYNSHMKAAAAIRAGKFKDEIVPVMAKLPDTDAAGHPTGKRVVFETDESVRANLTIEMLAKLRPAFKANGVVTAGNASQMNDAAAFVVLMEEEAARASGLVPIARFKSFAVTGLDPAYMGLGPITAIPKALRLAGLSKEDIDLFELNEAFASQAIACMDELGLDAEKVNVNGGGIALGHPLGATGAYLTMKLLAEMRRRENKLGMVSMCVGGGMGAAAIFEAL